MDDNEKKERPVVIIGWGGFSTRTHMLSAQLVALGHSVVMVDKKADDLSDYEGRNKDLLIVDETHTLDPVKFKSFECSPVRLVEYRGKSKGDKKKARAALRRQWGIK